MKTAIKTCTHCNSPYDTALTHVCLTPPAGNFDLPQPNLGMVIDKKYRLEDKLGEGGMGSVFRARRLFIDDFVAIKFVRPEVLTNPEFRERFYQEARVAARIKHPNVVTIYDFGETPDGMLYLVMEFLEGMSLGELLKKKGALTPAQMIELGLQIGEALHCMHENNVIHRDLKPDNIMLIPDSKGGERVKLVDFGVAKILEADARLTRYQARIGSPVYCSPEQYLGQPVDHRTDLYGLGIIFYECLSGRVPFNAHNETDLRAAILHKMPPRLDSKAKQVSSHLADLVQWLLAKDPNERPRHATEVNKWLNDLRRGLRAAPAAAGIASSPRAGTTANSKNFTPNNIKFDEKVSPVPKKEKPATPSSPDYQKQQKPKHVRSRYFAATMVLSLIGASLAIWQVPELAIARKYFIAGWQELTLQIKNFPLPWKTSADNLQAAASRKVVATPARPRVTETTTPTAPTVNPTAPPTLPNAEAAQKLDASPNTRDPIKSANAKTDLRFPDGNKKESEGRRNNVERTATPKINKPTTTNNARNLTETPARSTVKPPAPKVLTPPAGMILMKSMEFKRGDLFGDGNANERPAHLVRVDDFFIATHEVTNREYLAFVKATGGNFPEWMNPNSKYHYQTGSDTFYKKLGPALYNLDHPVIGVSWQDAIMYCAWLSLKGPYKYRLPTEAEWELAARSGNNSVKYSWGNGAPLPQRGGNVGDEALKRVFPDWPVIWRAYNDNYAFTAPVEKFGANKVGVFDMTGNVAEWCGDWYESGYYQKLIWDRPGGPTQGTERVIRGGSWSDTPTKLRITYRRSAPPTFRSNNLGFRIVATMP